MSNLALLLTSPNITFQVHGSIKVSLDITFTNSMSYHDIFQSLHFLFRSSVFIKFFLNWLCHCRERTIKDTHKNRMRHKLQVMASDLKEQVKSSQIAKKNQHMIWSMACLPTKQKTLGASHLNFDDGWLCLKFFSAHFTTKNISLIQQKHLKEGKRKSQREHLLSIYFKTPFTLNIWKLILPSSWHTFPCKFTVRLRYTTSTW